jgi:hypothetical protein
MDVGNAALLVFVAFAITQFVKQLIPGTADPRIVQAAALLVGIGATVLVGHSDWGHKQVIDGIPLDTMNGASQLLVGLAIGSGATALHQTLRAVSNVGQNQPPTPDGAGGPNV